MDTNVAFDLIANREPFVHDSIHFLELSEKGEVQLFVSEVSLGTIVYLAFERYRLPDAKEKLLQFFEFCEVISGGRDAFISAMDSDFSDKEDALQYFVSISHRMNVLITRDKKDFKHAAHIPVMTPQEFFSS